MIPKYCIECYREVDEFNRCRNVWCEEYGRPQRALTEEDLEAETQRADEALNRLVYMAGEEYRLVSIFSPEAQGRLWGKK